MGSSSGIMISKPILAEIGMKAVNEVEISALDGQLLIAAQPSPSRAGWAEASRLIGSDELGEDELVWLKLGNDGDRDLCW